MALFALKEHQLDALMEISNIGVGHAATAFSQLLGTRVDIRVPDVAITDISEVPDKLGGADKPVVLMFLKMLGDAEGDLVVIFPKESADKMVAMLLKQDVSEIDIFTEMAQSALREVGNILASAYLSALGSILNLSLIPSTPNVAYDMLGAAIDTALMDIGRSGDKALMIETEMFIKDEELKGSFFLMPDPASIDVLLSILGQDN
ncbi:MAG: chemotaxis protein CheC [Proteobacteria bacterium]|nr:chemotaxis protein CheC [Pseudomonadota bacterium]